MSKLFSPLTIGNVTLPNRITVAPMCQYSAVDGSMTDWHVMHLGNLALSGASMLVIEATGVVPEGRITPQCVGLYSDANEAAMARVVTFVRSVSPIVIGIQLGHAGRKASAHRPWSGRGALKPADGAWTTAAPSAVPLAADWPMPHALSVQEMANIKAACVASVKRAARIGLDFVEMHSTHGYLASEFLSPLSNKRSDEYGGSLANRMRWPLEVFRAMREAWPSDKFIGAKISGSDFAEGGWTPDEAAAYAGELKKAGAAYVTVSGGGVVLDAKVPIGPGYQVPFAERVKRETGITTGAVGLITDPLQAEEIITSGKADFVSLARAMLFNPRWGQHAAVTLGALDTEGATVPYAQQYDRSSPKLWPPGKTLGKLGN
jgi:2,4-dienoyl-CoA reductase-like NADH-dependent reductase (Old Yellow Enzyme family)